MKPRGRENGHFNVKMLLARQTAKLSLSWFVLLAAQLSAEAAWIEILEQPPFNVIAGEVLPPSAQPLVALWNHRRAFDIFGREIPAQIVYDSEIPGVLVNANLLSMNSSGSHDLFGSSLLMTRCGKAQFTNLMIPKVGVYKLLFSATYFSNNETTNATKAFEVVHGPAHHLVLVQEPQGFWMNRPFQVQPIIEVRDITDNVVLGSSAVMKVKLIVESTNYLGFIRNDALELRAVAGVARFQELPCSMCVGLETKGIAISFPWTGIRLEFWTTYGIAPIRTGKFDVGMWPPKNLYLVPASSPQDLCCQGGETFKQQPRIHLLDTESIIATWHPSEKIYVAVTIQPRSTDYPTDLKGTTKVEVVRGIAQFTDLRHDYMAIMYSLRFKLITTTVSGIAEIDTPLFDVVNGVAFQLSLNSSYGNPSTIGTQPGMPQVGFPLQTQPVVLVLDKVGNMLWESAINVTAHLLTADGNKKVQDDGFAYNSTRTVISCPLFKGRHDCSKCRRSIRIFPTCGTAPFTDLRVDRSIETLILRFSSPGLKSVDSLPFIVPLGEIYALFVEQEPLGFKYNTWLRQQPLIAIKDRGNNTVSFDGNNTRFIAAELCTNTLASNTCLDTSTSTGNIANVASIVNGIARFTDMKIRLVGTNMTIRFCSKPSGLRCTYSTQFEVTEDPTQLLVRTHPSRGIPGFTFPVAPVVQVVDMHSSTSTWTPDGFVINSTLCVLVGPLNATEEEWKCAPDGQWLELNALSTCDYQPPDTLQTLLQGETSRKVVEGLASFSDLRIDKVGTYKLKFTAGGLVPAETDPFSVAVGMGVCLSVLVHASGVQPGLPFQTQPVVAVVDQGGNNIETDHGTKINATLWTTDRLTNLGLVPTHFIAPRHSIAYHDATQLTRFGVAVFEGLRIDKAGTYIIRYSSDLYTSVESPPLQANIGIGVQLNIAVRPTGCCSSNSCNFRSSDEPTCITLPVISILDSGGNLVPWNGVKINATVFTRHGTDKEHLQSFVAISDDHGQASFTDFGMTKSGNYTVRFRNISPYNWRTRHPDGSWTDKYFWDFAPTEVNFSVSGRLSRLYLENQPAEIIPGEPMLQQPTVIMYDDQTNVVDHDFSTLVTVSVNFSNGESVMIGGQKIKAATPTVVTNYSDDGGRIIFTDLRIDLAGRCMRMYFSAPTYSGGSIILSSLQFNVEVGRFHRVAVVQQPGKAVLGLPFGIQPHVALTDFGGNIVAEDSQTVVTASVFQGTTLDVTSESGKLQILRLDKGRAQFVDLKTNIATPCMQLEILAVGRQPGYSLPFEIQPSEPYRVAFLDDGSRDRIPIQYGPAGPRSGLPLTEQPMLKVEDMYGNKIGVGGGLFGGVTATLLEGGKFAQCSYPIKHCLKGTTYVVFNQLDGIARFTNLRIDRANMFGPYSIVFTSNDLTRKRLKEGANVTTLFYSLLPIESNRNMFVIPGNNPVGLEVIEEPDKFLPGFPMKVLPVVGVVDAGGNVVTSATPTTILCKIRAENVRGIELIGDPLILANDGRGSFEGLGVSMMARNVTLTFDASVIGLGTVDTFAFDVSGPLTRLALLAQTSRSKAGEIFSVDAVVRGFDVLDFIVTTFGHPPFPLNTADVVTVAINTSSHISLRVRQVGGISVLENTCVGFCCINAWMNETTVLTGDVVVNTTDNQTIDERVNTTINTTTVCSNDTRLQGTTESTYTYSLTTFTDLRIEIAGTYYLRFTVPVLNISIVSQPVVIMNAMASELRMITEAQDPKEATFPLKQAPEAVLLDRFGNLVLDRSFTAVATFFQGLSQVPAHYVQGILQINSSKAIISFKNNSLGLSLAGNDFSIRLSVEGLPSIFTAPFEVSVGAPYRLRVLSLPTRFFEKEPFTEQPSFEVLDRGNNLVKSNDNATVSLWNMRGCCPNTTNSKANSTCTDSQEAFVREYDSNRLPCGQRVSGLYIFQPFCLAEYLQDTITSFCSDVLGDFSNDTKGTLNRNNKEGNFPTQWFFSGHDFRESLEMRITSYLDNSSYLNQTSTQTVENNATLAMLHLRYNILLVSNGTVVEGSCVSSLNGLSPRLYNLTDWVPLCAKAYEEDFYGNKVRVCFEKFELRQILARSNLAVANLNTTGTSKLQSHNCTKYNFTRNLESGAGSFSQLGLLSPSLENLKLRITFKDREYIPFYTVSTHYAGPGYRLYRQDIMPTAPPPPPPPSSSLSLPSRAPVVNYSNYHLIVETLSFQVSGAPAALKALTLPSRISYGGTAFTPQPSFKVVDIGSRLVTKELDMVVTATLVANASRTECNAARPYRCPWPTDICALSESYCPKLRGTAQVRPVNGFASFTDLSITVCNDNKVPYFICVFGEFRVRFEATSYRQSLMMGAGIMTPPVNISLQSVLSDKIDNFIGPPAVLFMAIEPIGGVRADERLPRQPSILTQDAGGNRIISTAAKLTAVLSVFNGSVPLEDYTLDGIKGTRTVSSTIDGTFRWTNLAISRSSDMFVINFVQFEAVPGFPKAPTVTSAPFVILAGYGVKMNIETQPSSGIGGEPLEVQPKLSVFDKQDNLVRFEAYNVSVRLSDESILIGASLSKAKMVAGIPVYDTSETRFKKPTTQGVAQFDDLIIDKVANCYRLVFSAPGLIEAVSDPFDVRAGPIRMLRIIRQPAGAVPGQVLKTQPLVHLSDWGKNPSRYNRDQVEITLVAGNLTANNSQELKVYGNNVIRATDGVLEYTDLMVYHAGVGLRLKLARFVGGMATIMSERFDVDVGIPYSLKVSTQPMGAVSGKFLQVQPQVQLEDAGGNRVVAGSHVITATLFEAGKPSTAALRGPECTDYDCLGQASHNSTQSIRKVCPTCVTTNTSAGRDSVTTVASKDGISQFTALAIGQVGDHYTIRFFAYLVLGAESHPPMSVNGGLPVRLTFERAPEGFLLDTPFRVQPIIQLIDSGGNVVVDHRPTYVYVELERPKNSQLLPVGNTKVFLFKGRANFVELKVDKPGIGFTLLFTGNMCANVSHVQVQCIAARSRPFNVTGPRTHVVNNVQVETSIVNKFLSPQPQVHLLDAEIRTVNWDSGRLIVTVDIDPVTNLKNATLSGSLRVPCCAGMCAFTDLVIDKALTGYRLLFSAPPFDRLMSPLFDVVGPRYLRVSQQPIAYATGEPFVVQPQVEVLDIYRKLLSGYWLTVSVEINEDTGPAGGLLHGTTSLLTNESTVVFTDLQLNGYGSRYVLKFLCLWFEPALSEPFDVDFAARPHVCRDRSRDGVCTAP